jgi:hypothetical protein
LVVGVTVIEFNSMPYWPLDSCTTFVFVISCVFAIALLKALLLVPGGTGFAL